MIVRCHTCGGSLKEISELNSQLVYERGKVAELRAAVKVLAEDLLDSAKEARGQCGDGTDPIENYISDVVLANPTASAAIDAARSKK